MLPLKMKGKYWLFKAFHFHSFLPLNQCYIFLNLIPKGKGVCDDKEGILAVPTRRAPQTMTEKGFPHSSWRITTLLRMSSILTQAHSTALDISVISLALLSRIRSILRLKKDHVSISGSSSASSNAERKCTSRRGPTPVKKRTLCLLDPCLWSGLPDQDSCAAPYD